MPYGYYPSIFISFILLYYTFLHAIQMIGNFIIASLKDWNIKMKYSANYKILLKTKIIL